MGRPVKVDVLALAFPAHPAWLEVLARAVESGASLSKTERAMVAGYIRLVRKMRGSGSSARGTGHRLRSTHYLSRETPGGKLHAVVYAGPSECKARSYCGRVFSVRFGVESRTSLTSGQVCACCAAMASRYQ